MKRIFSFLFLSCLIACSSVERIKKNPNCVVWKDQKYLGPYSIEVIAKKINWKGKCKGGHWNCEFVDVGLDESNNILINSDTNIGKIENNEFHYSLKNITPMITYSSLKAVLEKNEVVAVDLENSNNTVVYQTNGKCTSEESIIGAISLGLIAKIQAPK